MTALAPGRRSAAVSALVAARIVYAFNWYNVGAVLPIIGSSLHASTPELGLVLGAFLVGVAIFQIPAGLASVRYGPRRVSLAGIALFGSAGIVSAFAPSWPWLALLRFVGGIGAAFFFSPALSLIAAYFPPARRGPIVGLYNGGFSLGGALGLFAGAALGVSEGWPAALGFGGAALLGATAVSWLVVPKAPDGSGRTGSGSVRLTGIAVIRSRSIWALSLALTGFWGAVYVVAQYFVDFAHTAHPEWGIGGAALLTATVVVMAFPGGPIGGWLAERGGDRRWLIGIAGFGASVLFFAIPFASFLELWPLFLVLGFLDGLVFAILYLIPTYLPETAGEGLALGVAVLNSVQVILGSAIAIAFGFIAGAYGYTDAWLFVGAISAGLVPLLWGVAPSRARHEPVPLGPREGAEPLPTAAR
ncbi:MAG TPA: MFS transporter [Thermoplasmata archaeon]|nr:MFS transporter [Thermoplasmata archaeon]